MGKLKNAIIAEQEQMDSRLYPKLANQDPRNSGIQNISDEELAVFDREFNEWLNAYEKSFGNRGDLL